MLIAHISDFHVFAKTPETTIVRPDAADAARKVVADIAAFTPKIEAVMFTGDMTDGGAADDYALLGDILSPLDVPVFMVPEITMPALVCVWHLQTCCRSGSGRF